MTDEMDYLKYLDQGYDRDQILCELMENFGEDVWNFAYFLTRRREAADDLSQEVFLAAYNGIYAFRGDCSVKSWLLTITRNKAMHVLQSAFIRKVTLTDRLFARNNAPPAEQVIFTRLENRHLWHMVLQLPRKYREVLILDYHYGLKQKEIAKLLRVSEGTVKSRSHRAKKTLNKWLSQEYKEADERERR
ncbi:sigma-70 family RNA polymerase sigma factor [Bacillus sp. 3255]|uniref:RNA polymerase sigma factor n=1 Tax=Bacillus sp. 3255 TaxID=2817904 RepID=UPI0028623B4C|nr:sigma-70 family RNA polymerase sigma factor [Bacillus sp. 3255]MDR6879820.1 RNA polymerase sigma-70 factor (ECF subfamily) [Bacillus sp. 3255]